MVLWTSMLATLQLVRAVDPGADQQANNRNHQRKPTKPWCRKSAALTAVNSLNGEEVNSVLLWAARVTTRNRQAARRTSLTCVRVLC